MIFSFEGIDGSGKSTVIKAVEQKLTSPDGKVKPITRAEPSHTGMGLQIRELIQTGEAGNVPFDQWIQMWVEDRRAGLEEIGTKTDQGWVFDGIVLSDRCYLSTLAYQTAQYPDKAKEIVESQREFFDLGVKHYWLRISPKKAVARCMVRAKDDRRSWDNDYEFIEKVAAQYDALFEGHEHRIMTVDATRPVDEIAEVIAQDIKHEMKL